MFKKGLKNLNLAAELNVMRYIDKVSYFYLQLKHLLGKLGQLAQIVSLRLTGRQIAGILKLSSPLHTAHSYSLLKLLFWRKTCAM